MDKPCESKVTGEYCEGGDFSDRKVPSLALPPEKTWGRMAEILGGEALLSEKRLSPQTPLSRRAAGVRRVGLLLSWFRLKGGAFPIGSVESTAADRAAADVRGMFELYCKMCFLRY